MGKLELEILKEIRVKIHIATKLCKVLPHRRKELCKSITTLARLALDTTDHLLEEHKILLTKAPTKDG